MSETKIIHMKILQCLIREGLALAPAAKKSDLSGAGGNFELHCIQNELQESLAQVRSSCGAHLRALGCSIMK